MILYTDGMILSSHHITDEENRLSIYYKNGSKNVTTNTNEFFALDKMRGWKLCIDKSYLLGGSLSTYDPPVFEKQTDAQQARHNFIYFSKNDASIRLPYA